MRWRERVYITVLDTKVKENQNTLLGLHELLYPLIMQRCKLHKVLLIIYTMMLAFSLVEKCDLNLLYKYSKKIWAENPHEDTRCTVCTNTQCRGGGGASLLPWRFLGAALLKTPGWARSHSLHMEGHGVWQALVHNKAVSGRAHRYKPQVSWNKPAGPCVCWEHRTMIWLWKFRLISKGPSRNIDTIHLLWVGQRWGWGRLSELSSPRVNTCDICPGSSEEDNGGTSLALPDTFLKWPVTLTSGLEAHVFFFSSAVLPQGHLASLSWWEEAKAEVHIGERGTVNFSCWPVWKLLYWTLGDTGRWQHTTPAGGNSLQTTIWSHLSSQRQSLVFEQYKKNNNRNKMGKEPKRT